ncbi:hypothetical protein [Arthrobacter sp. ISL-48]|uniref:hypothetical protein n=1 Tax=Arthrobacter sp. ISL-48 TaxID=2819110 RepID=UPI001BE62AC1|nr:hypothetical protein [Arthrobacter sp. ISL-48]
MMKPNDADTVLLTEPSISGHRLAYVRLLAEESLKRDHQVHIALPEGGRESAEFATHLGHLFGDIELSVLPKFNLKGVEAHSRLVNAERTVITDGDALALQLARAHKWNGSGRVSVLIMREHAQPDNSRIKMWMKNHAKQLIYSWVSSIKDVDLALLKSSLWTGRCHLRTATDPIQLSCTEADVVRLRHEWNLGESEYWFAVLGAITPRKNVRLIAECLAAISSGGIGLLIAGKIDTDLRVEIDQSVAQLSAKGASIKIVDRLLTDIELDAAVLAVDCLVLAHSNEGPSGLLGKAASAATTVVSAGAISLRNDMVALGGSAQWSPLQHEPLSLALRKARESHVAREPVSSSTSSFLEALVPRG